MFQRFTTLGLSLACAALLVSTAEAAGGLKVVVILDNSGSMNGRMTQGGRRIDAAKQSLLKVLDQVPEDAEVGVLLINSPTPGQWLIPLGPVDRDSMQAAVNSITAGGPTPLGKSMKLAADALLQVREAQRYGTYKLLVVSDGEATDGNLVERFLPEVQARGILIDVIGVAMQQQLSLAKQANTYRRADDPASLEKAISAVVLGESANDLGGDAGESDFEIIAPLSAEAAAASLTALTARHNRPIGESARFEPQPDRRANGNQGQPAGRANPPNVAQPNNGGKGQGQGISVTTLLFGAVVLFIVMRVFGSIGKVR